MVNRENYLLIRSYLHYMSHSKMVASVSVRRYWFYLRHLLLWLDETPLVEAPEKSPVFPRYLAVPEERKLLKKSLAPASMKKIIRVTKSLMEWIRTHHMEIWNNSIKEWTESLQPVRIPPRINQHVFIILDEVLHLVNYPNPAKDIALTRDQAAAAMLFLSGMRVGVLATLPIEAVDIPNRAIRQWNELGVSTKGQKSSTTYLLEIPALLDVVTLWDTFIRKELPPSAMWYTPIISHWGDLSLYSGKPGRNRVIAVEKRMRLLFQRAGIPYKSPHKFRHGHAVYALRRAKTMADYKAISMNLMHDDIRVTDGVYAPFLGDEVRQRIGQLGEPGSPLSLIQLDPLRLGNGRTKDDLAEVLRKLADQLGK